MMMESYYYIQNHNGLYQQNAIPDLSFNTGLTIFSYIRRSYHNLFSSPVTIHLARNHWGLEHEVISNPKYISKSKAVQRLIPAQRRLAPVLHSLPIITQPCTGTTFYIYTSVQHDHDQPIEISESLGYNRFFSAGYCQT